MLNLCRLFRRLFYCVLFAALLPAAQATPAKTPITDILYRADGTPATGTLLISWPAFTTADNQAVAAGTLSVNLGPAGAISLQLAPNAGATPSGTTYRVVMKLDEAVSQREIVDEQKFRDGLGKTIDGVVQCLNASTWAKAKS